MKREDAITHFTETYLKPKINEKLFALDKYFHENKGRLVSAFLDSFRNICIEIKKMQASGEKGKIGFITYSMLRTALLERSYCMLIEAFNEDWFLDLRECHAGYEASWAFGFLEELGSELGDITKLYIGNIVGADIERIKLKEAEKFNEYVKSLARYAMPEALRIKEYMEIQREEVFEIRVGEYRDTSEIVYKEDRRIKDSKEIKEFLEEKLEDEYSYEVFTQLDLSDGNYKEADFRYADFRKSNLSKSNMSECILVGAKFNHGILEGTDFSNSIIYGTDFSQCKLKGAHFYRAEGPAGVCGRSSWEMPGFEGINFMGADLEDADFESADLRGAVFIDANIKGTNFTGANLENTVFSEKDANLLDLDERQHKVVKWLR